MDNRWKYLLDPKNWSKKYQILGIVILTLIISFMTITPIKSIIGFAIMAAITYAIMWTVKTSKKLYQAFKLNQQYQNNIQNQQTSNTEQTLLTTHEENAWESITKRLKDDK